MGRIGPWEVIIIVAVIVLLFGAKKIPEIASAVGKAIREFKRAGKDIDSDVREVTGDKDNGHKST